MPRILLLIILFWLLYKVLKRLGENATKPPPAKPSERIVQCAQCGMRVLESESHLTHGQVTCNNPQCDSAAQKQHGN